MVKKTVQTILEEETVKKIDEIIRRKNKDNMNWNRSKFISILVSDALKHYHIEKK